MPAPANGVTQSLEPISCFFFSSRRRHTRLQGDWSSDVCSSDLASSRLAFSIAICGSGRAGAGGVTGAIGSGFLTAAGGGGGVTGVSTARGARSGERRVGEEGRSRWAPDHLKKKKRR